MSARNPTKCPVAKTFASGEISRAKIWRSFAREDLANFRALRAPPTKGSDEAISYRSLFTTLHYTVFLAPSIPYKYLEYVPYVRMQHEFCEYRIPS